MRVTSLDELLGSLAPFDGLDRDDLATLAGCGRNELVPAGTILAREGSSADRMYVVRRGRLRIQLPAPGGPLVIETAGPGAVVGWSWIFPPYRWTAEVEAGEQAHVVAIDGRCLRDKSEIDPAFGYRIMRRLAIVMARQLEATNVRLLDLYGDERAGALPARDRG